MNEDNTKTYKYSDINYIRLMHNYERIVAYQITNKSKQTTNRITTIHNNNVPIPSTSNNLQQQSTILSNIKILRILTHENISYLLIILYQQQQQSSSQQSNNNNDKHYLLIVANKQQQQQYSNDMSELVNKRCIITIKKPYILQCIQYQQGQQQIKTDLLPIYRIFSTANVSYQVIKQQQKQQQQFNNIGLSYQKNTFNKNKLQERANQLLLNKTTVNYKQPYNQNSSYLQALSIYQYLISTCNNYILTRSDRANYYSQSAYCLQFNNKFIDNFTDNRYHESIQYAQIAITINTSTFATDPYIHQINAYLQLNQYWKVPQLIVKISGKINQQVYCGIIKKYGRYLANSLGYYNWFQILSSNIIPNKAKCSYADYLSMKIKNNNHYYAVDNIQDYQLLILFKNTNTNSTLSFLQYFQHSCTPNCSSILFNNNILIVSSILNINIGQPLAIDYAHHIQQNQRRQFLMSKWKIKCSCQDCEPIDVNNMLKGECDRVKLISNKSINVIKRVYRQNVFHKLFSHKTILCMYTDLINQHVTWQDISDGIVLLNKIKQSKNDGHHNDNCIFIETMIIKGLAKFLKIKKRLASQILTNISL